MEKKYNMKSPGVKRLMREAIELKDPTPMFSAQPLEENLFEWHFTILGPQGTDYEGGRYHGRILLPTEYPMKPPSIIFLTPNGRFELYQKICLSASSYHPELWQPSWSIRTVLLAMIGFMPTEGVGAIGSLEVPSEERRRLARRSMEWVCPVCRVSNKDALVLSVEGQSHNKEMAEAADIVTQMAFKSESEVKAQKLRLSQQSGSQTTPPTSKQTTVPGNQPQSEAPQLRKRLESQDTPQTTTTEPETIGAATTSTAQQTNTLFSPSPKTAVPSSPPRSKGQGSFVLLLLLILAVLVLVCRRVYLHLNSDTGSN